jgi:hypothetical protein
MYPLSRKSNKRLVEFKYRAMNLDRRNIKWQIDQFNMCGPKLDMRRGKENYFLTHRSQPVNPVYVIMRGLLRFCTRACVASYWGWACVGTSYWGGRASVPIPTHARCARVLPNYPSCLFARQQLLPVWAC